MKEWEDNMRKAMTPEGIITEGGILNEDTKSWKDNFRSAWTPTGLKLSNVSPTGKVAYTHDQTVSSNRWLINHNLGFMPNVSIVDSAGTNCVGELEYINNNTLIINFSAPMSGKAYLS